MIAIDIPSSFVCLCIGWLSCPFFSVLSTTTQQKHQRQQSHPGPQQWQQQQQHFVRATAVVAHAADPRPQPSQLSLDRVAGEEERQLPLERYAYLFRFVVAAAQLVLAEDNRARVRWRRIIRIVGLEEARIEDDVRYEIERRPLVGVCVMGNARFSEFLHRG